MAKREFDSTITSSLKTAASGSFADNIKMIDIEKIVSHRENFYSMSDIELLADDIERQGLKENLVVRDDVDDDGYYTVISGHRRRQAIIMLINENRLSSRLVPCYINPAKNADDELQDLIMLNATTRVISDSEMLAQYEKLKTIFENKKANGEKVNGRIRERVAEILNISTGKAAMIESVLKDEKAREAVDNWKTSISTAHKSAKKGDSKKSVKNDTKEELSENVSTLTQNNEPSEDVSTLTQSNEPFENVSTLTQNEEPKKVCPHCGKII